MKATGSRWAAFLMWSFAVALLYGFVGAALHVWTARLAFGFDIMILAGFISAKINDDPEALPRYGIDWFMVPILVAFLATIATVALHCPAWWLALLAPLMIAGYAAGAPAFGSKIQLFFLDRVLPYPYLFVIWIIVTCTDAWCWLETHRRIIAVRMLVICRSLGFIAMLYGWYTYDLRFVAIGLGFLLGEIGTSGGYTTSGLTRFALAASCIISLVRLSPHVSEVLPSDPMYAVAAGFVALALTALENPKRRNCK